MNWLYDHLRHLVRFEPLVVADQLEHRDEFSELTAWDVGGRTLPRRAWRRLFGVRPFPTELWRIRRTSPALLHSHFGYVAVDDEGLANALDRPWIAGFYGADVYELGRQSSWRKRYETLFRRITGVLALGPAMKRELAALGCPAERVLVHPLGVDVDALPWRVRRRGESAPLRLLFAGTFREKKGLPYLLEAAAIARRKGIRLQLAIVGDSGGKIGDDETKKTIFETIDRLRLDDVVAHRPFLTFDALMALALESHVFAAPSVTASNGDAEGTPFVVQQMMATAMPVISTMHSDIPFVFGNLQNMLVSERDVAALADRICYYAEHASALEADGLAVRDQVRQHLNVRDCAARLDDIYAHLAAGGVLSSLPAPSSDDPRMPAPSK